MRFFILALLLVSPAHIHAQWRLALLSGTASSSGDARDATDPAHPEFHAEGPSTLSIALARQRGAWRIGVEVRHTSADLAEVSASTVVMTRGVLKAWGGAIELARRMAGLPDGPALNVAFGAGVDRWSFDLDESAPRTRTSVRGAVEMELPISSRWAAVIRGQTTAGPSVFKAEELPEGFVRRTAVRVGLALGISRRL